MRVLLVEDEHKIAQAIKKGLEHERYAVDMVHDGIEGFDMASVEQYDLIILDRMLPGMEGVEIAQKLRAKKIHTPILFLTAKGQIRDRIEGLDMGADDYMTKPFAFAELLARMRALLRRPKEANNKTLEVEDLVMDPVHFKVERSGVEIDLSKKEFALLEYLLRHANSVVSKNQIIDHVWNYDADILPNSVEVYIKHLRNKIDKPFQGAALISTVRGFGYKIGGSR